MKNIWILGLLILMLGGCKKDAVDKLSYQMGTPFQLAIGQTAECSCGAPTIVLRDIQDSRCPTGVDCIWAGEVKAVLDVNGVSMTLGLSPNVEVEPSGSVDGYMIELRAVTPYPQYPNDIPSKDYRAELKVVEEY
ncbi:MAG: hypothetical protein HUU34_07320 [Saprospiraceae bacterium]|nr:hypothetical protein [Saprospiraceae bacterium]